jgi:hypothetical protein
MISCQTFRATVQRGSEDPSILEHLRTCDACLDHALAIDPDFFFRSIGGSEMTPPGGVDSFVNDVMAQVRSRQAETSVSARLPIANYFRAAAAVLFVIAASTGIYRVTRRDVVAVAPAVVARVAVPRPTMTKAVVETYEAKNATIVEVPSGSAADARVVMIYDESLPADL